MQMEMTSNITNLSIQVYDQNTIKFRNFSNFFFFLNKAAFVLALLIHTSFGPFEFGWSYSIWLEALAIIPQLSMIVKIKDVKK